MISLDETPGRRLFMSMRKNPATQREVLGSAILRVRSGQATSRTALSRVLGISPSTTGMYADHLIAAGWLDESGLKQGPMGRPRRLLTTRAEAGWFAGVEFHAQRLQAVGVDFSGNAAATVATPLPFGTSAAHVIETILSSVTKLAESMHGPLLSVGLGVPGLVDPQNGVGIHYVFIRDWNQVPVAEKIRAGLKVPVILQNNLRAIALAERWFGMGHELNDFVILGPRSGFGVAIMHEGRLVNGSHHAAGEVGRWRWPLGGGLANSEELHHELSASATWRRLAGKDADAKIPADLRAALAEFENASGPVWQAVCADFARVIGCMHLLLDPEVFILHGPLTVLGRRFCEDIIAAAEAIYPALAETTLKVVSSLLEDDAGALGAASLAMESWLPE